MPKLRMQKRQFKCRKTPQTEKRTRIMVSMVHVQYCRTLCARFMMFDTVSVEYLFPRADTTRCSRIPPLRRHPCVNDVPSTCDGSHPFAGIADRRPSKSKLREPNVCVYIYIYIYRYISISISISTHICVCKNTYTSANVFKCACVYVYINILK